MGNIGTALVLAYIASSFIRFLIYRGEEEDVSWGSITGYHSYTKKRGGWLKTILFIVIFILIVMYAQ